MKNNDIVILGINSGHPDSSACIIINGELIFAIEEERINRVKHWAGLPINAIEACLNYCNITILDVDYIATNTNPTISFFRKIIGLNFNLSGIARFSNKLNIINQLSKYFNVKINAKLFRIEHHMAHHFSAAINVDINDTTFLSIDGMGDSISSSYGYFINGKFKQKTLGRFPNSLGFLYQAITQYLGFKNYGDEYKIMGLSAYGYSGYEEKIRKLISFKNKIFINKKYFKFDKIILSNDNGVIKYSNLYNKNMVNLLGQERQPNDSLTQEHKNIAYAVQKVYTEILNELIDYIYAKKNNKVLALSGGCAMNSLANGQIIENSSFDSLIVPPNAGDGGGAVGAAVAAYYSIKKCLPLVKNYQYLGSQYSDEDICTAINKYNNKINYEKLNDDQMVDFISSELVNLKIIGWFQGKSEWGPRALGNRSIIANPMAHDLKDIMNLKIKRREAFRPFAPAILSEEVDKWFNTHDNVPYMEKVYKIKHDKQSIIPAVCHIDGTGRLQTVSKLDNKLFYNLIKKFEEKTGVPILVNTSFNENEPIVNTPENAIDCFLRTNMDILVINDYCITRT
jgi:carbamoyltransferase